MRGHSDNCYTKPAETAAQRYTAFPDIDDVSSQDPEYTAVMEQRAHREAFERAGYDAYVLGVPRKGNPYARQAQDHQNRADRMRQERLCEYWWCGWDRAAATSPGRRRTRRKQGPP